MRGFIRNAIQQEQVLGVLCAVDRKGCQRVIKRPHVQGTAGVVGARRQLRKLPQVSAVERQFVDALVFDYLADIRFTTVQLLSTYSNRLSDRSDLQRKVDAYRLADLQGDIRLCL